MKKKSTIVLLTAFVVLSLVAALTACSFTTGDAKIADDYDPDTVNAKIAELQAGSGFKLSYTAEGTDDDGKQMENLSYGAKGDIYYYQTSDTEVYFDLSSDQEAVTYTKTDGVWSKKVQTYTDGYTKADMEANVQNEVNAAMGYMTYYYNMEGGMVKGTAEVLGRTCDTYTVGGKVGSFVSFSTVISIDKATGICLKWEVSGQALGQSGDVTFTCTEFNTNPTFTLPTVDEEHTTREVLHGNTDENENANENGDEDETGDVDGNGNEEENGNVDESGNVDAGGKKPESGKAIELPATADVAAALDVKNGFSLTYRFYSYNKVDPSDRNFPTYEYYFTFDAKGNLFHILDTGEEGGERYFDTSDDTSVFLYEKQNSEWKRSVVRYDIIGFEKEDTCSAILKTLYQSAMLLDTEQAMTELFSNTPFAKTTGSYQVGGRACAVYTFNHSSVAFFDKAVVTIDDETGIVLSYEFSISDPDNAEETTAAYGIECTVFTTPYDLRLPDTEE